MSLFFIKLLQRFVLPLLVLALIVWYVRGQSLTPAADAIPSRES